MIHFFQSLIIFIAALNLQKTEDTKGKLYDKTINQKKTVNSEKSMYNNLYIFDIKTLTRIKYRISQNLDVLYDSIGHVYVLEY